MNLEALQKTAAAATKEFEEQNNVHLEEIPYDSPLISDLANYVAKAVQMSPEALRTALKHGNTETFLSQDEKTNLQKEQHVDVKRRDATTDNLAATDDKNNNDDTGRNETACRVLGLSIIGGIAGGIASTFTSEIIEKAKQPDSTQRLPRAVFDAPIIIKLTVFNHFDLDRIKKGQPPVFQSLYSDLCDHSFMLITSQEILEEARNLCGRLITALPLEHQEHFEKLICDVIMRDIQSFSYQTSNSGHTRPIRYIECATRGSADFIVTSENDLLTTSAPYQIKIIVPEKFEEVLNG